MFGLIVHFFEKIAFFIHCIEKLTFKSHLTRRRREKNHVDDFALINIIVIFVPSWVVKNKT